MALVYLAPALLALFGHGPAQTLGLLAWALMAVAFQPMLRFYRLSPLWGALFAADRARLHGIYRLTPPINMPASAAASGKAACSRT